MALRDGHARPRSVIGEDDAHPAPLRRAGSALVPMLQAPHATAGVRLRSTRLYAVRPKRKTTQPSPSRGGGSLRNRPMV